jgi:MoxR-like ATPase
MRRDVEQIYVEDDIEGYIVDVVSETRRRRQVVVGASPRGALALMKLSRAWAAMQGRSFVLPDDVKRFAHQVLDHRLILEPDLWTVRRAASDVIDQVLADVPVPVLPASLAGEL